MIKRAIYQLLKVFLIFVTLIFIAFKSKESKFDDDIYEVLTKWRNDTLGNTYRNKLNIDFLVEKLCLEEKNINDVIGILGNPNKSITDINNRLLQITYYSETSVSSLNVVVDSCDICFATFIINTKRNGKVDFCYICE